MSHPLLPETLSILSRLLSFNTESSRPNVPLVSWIRAYLSERQLPSTVRLNDEGDKATLLAHVGPTADGGVVLSGHTDVVDALRQSWTSPPFEMDERDGKLFGRGSCDMKGFIACVLAQAPAFAAAALKRPVHIALSRDEEIGVQGMPEMLAMIHDSGMTPAVALVGEPTEMKIVAGHKGGCEMRTVFTGAPAHSSLLPYEGCSAIVPAARFIVYLQSLAEELATAPVPGSPFHPPFATLNVGIVGGGVARNIVAGHCEVAWHYRHLPDEDPQDIMRRVNRHTEEVLLPEMRKGGFPAKIETTKEAGYPGLKPDPNSPALRLVESLTGKSDYSVAPFGADSGYYQQDGIPAVLIGPGSINQAHKPDEFVAVSELEKCLSFLDKLRERLANSDELPGTRP